jgi:BCD family chlorophyll transporter-like MFS transporter
MKVNDFSWFSIFRLGLVQTALGAIVVLTTSTLNRVMVVEIALPAMIPGALVTLHYAMQMLRPRMGHGSDMGQRRTPWIVGGMIVLAIGGAGASFGTAMMASNVPLGVAIAALSFMLVGGGVSAAGTSLLVLLAKRVHPDRRAAAATLVWMMMIMGFAVTATVAGKLLDPFSGARMVAVCGAVSALAVIVTVAAIWRVEGRTGASRQDDDPSSVENKAQFLHALKDVWQEKDARHFTIFVFVSMIAYSAQDLILEPFAGAIFGFTPGESTKLSGIQHGGVFTGMLLVAVITQLFKGKALASLKGWIIGGCTASGVALAGLVLAGSSGSGWPLRENVFLLGVANGAFSIAAIGAMMAMAGHGDGERHSRAGLRMGLWGASQAIAFGGGGFLGTILSDVARWSGGSTAGAYTFVFALEAVAFAAAAWLATNIAITRDGKRAVSAPSTQPAAITNMAIQTEGR